MKAFWLLAIGAVIGAVLTMLPKAVAHLHSAFAAAPSRSDVQRPHFESKFSFNAHAPIGQIGPLFGAEKEKLWAPHWNPEFIYPKAASDQQGMVFAVRHAHLRSTWVNTDFDLQNGHVQYVYVIPDTLVTVITLKLRPDGNQTQVEVQYDRTSLSAASDSHVQNLAEQDRKSGPEWESQINDYLDKNKAAASPAK